jgi:tricorn protease
VTRIDLEEVESRLVPFPVVSGYYSHLTAVSGGFVWLRHPQQGVLGSARAGVEGEAPAPTLEHWSLADRKLTVLAEGVTDLAVSGDGESLVLKQGENWVQVPSGRKVEDEDPARIVIDTGRLRLTVDPVKERRGMLWDNYRIMAQQFWRADMDGMDWHAMTSWYDPVIERLVTADDFQDMMWEVQGELGTSHAYVQGAVHKADPPMLPAHLGADLEQQGGRWVITRILPGDSSDPDARSPLLAPGVDARVGDAVLRVDGRDVGPEGIEAALVGSAGKPTELVLGRDGAEHRVAVTPLGDDSALRYQAWVESRRALVAELSDGRLGYLHIPDMVSSGWAQMHRDLREATTKEGLVVDVRYNSGGHTSQLVTDRIARRVLSWDYPRHERPGTYPAFAPRGAVVLVTNQEAGSDGDIVNAVSRALEVGPIIGTRTWGGVIGIDGRYDLVDGTGVTQPKYASWFEGEDWAIENYGVEPDIEVPLPPNAWVAGEDPQLARGVTEALARLEQSPAAVAPPRPAPRFGDRPGA